MLKESQRSKFTYFIILALVCIPFIFNWSGVHDFFSSPVSITISSVLITICLLINYNKACKVSDVLFIFINIFVLIINVAFYDSLGVVLNFYNIFLLLMILNNVEFELKQIQRIRLCIVILLGIFLLSLDVVQNYDSILVYLPSGYEINPNSFGILVLALYLNFVALVDNSSVHKWFKWCLFVVATVFAILVINSSDSRSVIIALVLFLLFYFIPGRKKINYKKILTYMVLIAVFFPIIYLWIVDTFDITTFLGKSFNSRVLVWESTIDLIEQYPLFGSGTIHDIQSTQYLFTASAHNVFLALWKTVGIIPLLSFCIYLIRGKNIANVTEKNVVAKKMFLSCLVICALETLLNDSNTSLFYMLLLLTAKDDTSEVKNDS